MNTSTAAAIAAPSISRPLPLNVDRPPSVHPLLPTPRIVQARGGDLDLGSFSGNATVTIAPWPLIAAGQRVWLRVNGTDESGQARSVVLLSGHALTDAQKQVGVIENLLRSDLLFFRDGSRLTISVSVAFDGADQERGAVAFPEVAYVLRKEPVQDIESFDDMDGSYEVPVDRPALTITRTNSPTVGVNDGRLSVQNGVSTYPKVSLTFKRSPRTVAFDGYFALPGTAYFTDSADITTAVPCGMGRVSFTAAAGRTIRSVLFATNYTAAAQIDNVVMTP